MLNRSPAFFVMNMSYMSQYAQSIWTYCSDVMTKVQNCLCLGSKLYTFSTDNTINIFYIAFLNDIISNTNIILFGELRCLSCFPTCSIGIVCVIIDVKCFYCWPVKLPDIMVYYKVMRVFFFFLFINIKWYNNIDLYVLYAIKL